MEEEMMYFQELIEFFKVKEAYKVDGMIEFGMEDFKKLQSLLNRLEQDERVIEKMAEYISDLDIDEDICKKRTEDCYADVYIENACKECVIDHFRKRCE